MLELIYESIKTVDFGTPRRAIYISAWDAILYHGSWPHSWYGIRKIFRDGTSFDIGSSNAGYYLSAEAGRGAMLLWDGLRYDATLLDEVTGLPLIGRHLNGVDLAGKATSGSFVDHIKGNVYTPGSHKIDIYNLSSGGLVKTLLIDEDVFSVGMFSILGYVDSESLYLTDDIEEPGKVALIDKNDGSIIFYGTVEPNNMGIIVDSTHKVVVVLLPSGKVAVYDLNNIGAVLSAPTLFPDPALYKLSRATTRLTSDDGQGIPGKPIQWWLSGNKGYLESTHTITDADGYASNWYYGPTNPICLGQETINVEVVL